MLQETRAVRRQLAVALCLAAIGCAVASPAGEFVAPLTPCEVLRDLATQDGRNIAVLGRYSFRENGRWIGEQSCVANGPAQAAAPSILWLVEDANGGPKPPAEFQLDGPVVEKKWAEVQRHTELGKFRFGTPDYDRWAVVWGRVETRKGADTKRAAANLIYRGSGVVFYLTR